MTTIEYFSNNSDDVSEKSQMLTEIEKQIAENNIHALFIVQSAHLLSEKGILILLSINGMTDLFLIFY
jgi:hypothetical protein